MDWRQYIHSDPNVLQGKAVVKGTRLSVAFILQLLASGWSVEQILENYPTLTPEALKAVFAFASHAVACNSLCSTKWVLVIWHAETCYR